MASLFWAGLCAGAILARRRAAAAERVAALWCRG